MVVFRFFYEMGHHMALQMIHIDKGNAERTGKSLGKADSHEKRAHKSGTAGEGNRRELFLRDASPLDGLVDHRHYILLMSSRSQLRNHSSISLVYRLRSRYVAQQDSVLQNCRRSVVTTAFYA